MTHFNTYMTKRVVNDNTASLRVWGELQKYMMDHPERLQSVCSHMGEESINGKLAKVLTKVYKFRGHYHEFVGFTRGFYERADELDHFTLGKGFEILEVEVGLVPKQLSNFDYCAIPMPKIRTQLAAPNFLTHCEDDFPDVDINLSNNSFTLPLNEAIKLAHQILRIADFHDCNGQKSTNKSSADAAHA